MIPAYTTAYGTAFIGDSRQLLAELDDSSINLVVTSLPFALQRKKEYGNKEQHEYVDWLAEFGALVYAKLTEDGSFVIDIGGAYEKGHPVRSLYQFRTLLKFCGYWLPSGRGVLLAQPIKTAEPHRMGEQAQDQGKGFRQHNLVVFQDPVAQGRCF